MNTCTSIYSDVLKKEFGENDNKMLSDKSRINIFVKVVIKNGTTITTYNWKLALVYKRLRGIVPQSKSLMFSYPS